MATASKTKQKSWQQQNRNHTKRNNMMKLISKAIVAGAMTLALQAVPASAQSIEWTTGQLGGGW
jgi:hypothetical protein